MENPRFNPILADIMALPPQMLFVVPEVDILLDEQLKFVQRLKDDIDQVGGAPDASETQKSRKELEFVTKRIEVMVFEDQIHGWLECMECPSLAYPDCGRPFSAKLTSGNLQQSVPSFVIDEKIRANAFAAASDFIQGVHRDYGWNLFH